MGIMACDRTGCDNIMCEKINHEIGYICSECFNELVGTQPSKLEEVVWFMNEPKYATSPGNITLDLYGIFVDVNQ